MPDPSGNASIVAWAGTSLVAGLAAIGAAVGWGRATTRLDEHQRRLDGHSEIMEALRKQGQDTAVSMGKIETGVEAIQERVSLCPRLNGGPVKRPDPSGC